MQMINHGITTGALFLCVGYYERTHSRLIKDNTGLAGPMPRFATCLMIFALSSLGLPGTNSFVGEFLVLAGNVFAEQNRHRHRRIGHHSGSNLSALAGATSVFCVPAPHERTRLVDLNAREMATLAPLVILVFWIGLFPNPFLSRMHTSVAKLLNGQTDVLETGMTPGHHAELEVKADRRVHEIVNTT